jgi:hypothetical protein
MEVQIMGLLTNVFRSTRQPGFSCLLLAGTFALATTPAFSANPNPETIQATYAQNGKMISVTLTIDGYSNQADMQALSQAFEEGQDQALVLALSKTKAAGHCSISGALSYEVAFIQVVLTPTGRRITFITNRPSQAGEASPDTPSQPFDLAVGQFNLNDTDNTKSTGFLYPASKLVINEKGEFHYDLAGTPWSLVNILDSRAASGETLAQGPVN